MSKKIALVLIMVMLVNMSAWANTSSTDKNDEEPGAVLVVLAVIGLCALLACAFYVAFIAEADAPDDGIRLASSQAEEAVSKATLNPLVNILSHVEVGKSQNDKVYAGLRFRF